MTAATITRTDAMQEIFGEPIHTYTRAQAIEDGMLIDVSTTAREAGIVWPVALTSAAWADACAWTDADDKRKGGGACWQSESGRLWDVVWMASRAIRAGLRRGHDGRDPILFQVLRIPRDGRGVRPRLATLKLQVGPGDAGEPVITIMLPSED
ncbi:conserved hypothetical protein [Thiomonas sp. X19]|uniref:DUF6573 family protein n=1 Tax=Thiomonas sp. X19 TaxID=1050370 RepID=UPI000B69D84E|nr:DUF6573 family protein [Thiomonas sp. X19]SCC95231.1 conserved hypothetical protein [Thiomonas sp. X19]